MFSCGSWSWRRSFICVSVLLLVLVVVDGVVSVVGLRDSLVFEANVLMAPFAAYWWFIPVKFLITGFVVFYFYKRINGVERGFRLASLGLFTVCVWYVGVIAWNVWVYQRIL